MYLWDASTRQLVGSLAAHDKRIWALDFTPGVSGTDAAGGGGSHLLASGSDDHLLKV
jgi:WD40 repeat protein